MPVSDSGSATLSVIRAQELLDFGGVANAQLAAFLDAEVPRDVALDQLMDFLRGSPDFVNPATITRGAAAVLWVSPDGIPMTAHAGVLRYEGQRSAADIPLTDGHTRDAGGHAHDAVTHRPAGDTAIVLGPYAWQFEPSDETDEVARFLQDTGFTVTERRNEQQSEQNVSIDDFRDLDRYQAVAIAAHGDGFSVDDPNSVAMFGTRNVVCVLTGDNASASDLVANQNDLRSGALILNGDTFAITQNFIREYDSDFENSIIYIGSCRSTFTADMADAFLDNGAAAFIGYSDYVGSDFADVRGQRLFSELLSGTTTGNVTGINVDRETDSDPALFQLIGSTDAALSIRRTHVSHHFGFREHDVHHWSQFDGRHPAADPEGSAYTSGSDEVFIG